MYTSLPVEPPGAVDRKFVYIAATGGRAVGGGGRRRRGLQNGQLGFPKVPVLQMGSGPEARF